MRKFTTMRCLLAFVFLFSSDFLTAAVTDIAAGDRRSLALKSDGTVWAWGMQTLGDNTSFKIPVQVRSLTNVTAIAEGSLYALFLKSDGSVWAWVNRNGAGDIDNGSNTDLPVPVLISSLTNVIAIAGGGRHCLALRSDGTVWTWGFNIHGQLGNGTNTDSFDPVQVSSLTNIIAIAGGMHHSLALKSDGSVWAWGFNLDGQLGNGTNTDSNVPVQVSSLTNVEIIAGGGDHSLALKSDGSVWGWGGNGNGQLGNGTYIANSNVPVQVSFLTNIVTIAGGTYHSLALKNDGSVWAWGRNNHGQLGYGMYDSYVPTQVGSPVSPLTDVKTIAGGDAHSLALKSDGSVWAWGSNDAGQLGNETVKTNTKDPVETTFTPIATPTPH